MKDALGTIAPTPRQVDEWLTSLVVGGGARDDDGSVVGDNNNHRRPQPLLQRVRVGTSVQGRPLYLYKSAATGSGRRRKRPSRGPSVLFLSLVHGNEPMGLLSHLWAIEMLLLGGGFAGDDEDDVDLLFFPIVNADAYALNVEFGQGCRRTNLRWTCSAGSDNSNNTTMSQKHNLRRGDGGADYADDDADAVHRCPEPSRGGVDLNRNHPVAGWDGAGNDDDEFGDDCGITYKGPEPWSEPESRAVRDVVRTYGPTAALSYHTRGFKSSPALLIHPFTSSRPLEQNVHLDLYRDWSARLNWDGYYDKTGSAMEVIGYTASGSTIDWMHSSRSTPSSSDGVISFVVESKTPCDGRWCLDYPEQVWNYTHRDGRTGVELVRLALERWRQQQRQEGRARGGDTLWSTMSMFAVLGLLTAVIILQINRNRGRGGLVLRNALHLVRYYWMMGTSSSTATPSSRKHRTGGETSADGTSAFRRWRWKGKVSPPRTSHSIETEKLLSV